MINFKKENKKLKAVIIALEVLAVGLVIYLIALPFYPSMQYKINTSKNSEVDYKDMDAIKKMTEEIIGAPINIAGNAGQESELHKNAAAGAGGSDEIVNAADKQKESDGGIVSDNAETNKSPEPAVVKISNTLIIPKIGVNIPIIESDNEEYGLNHGAWKLPKSSNPEQDGNMIITGHRFKYLPPSNLTFYLFHKLETGDIASVIWNNKPYYYRVKEIKTVSGDDISILKQTKTPTLTMYTCDPIYSTKNRLVVIAELTE